MKKKNVRLINVCVYLLLLCGLSFQAVNAEAAGFTEKRIGRIEQANVKEHYFYMNDVIYFFSDVVPIHDYNDSQGVRKPLGSLASGSIVLLEVRFSGKNGLNSYDVKSVLLFPNEKVAMEVAEKLGIN